MKTDTYPALGSRVSFVRQGVGTGIIEGEGIVMGIVLDISKRVMVSVETDEVHESGQKTRRNVHVSSLFPSDEYKAAFKASLDAVEALSQEGNGKAGEIVAEYNRRVDEAQQPVLGVPVEFDK